MFSTHLRTSVPRFVCRSAVGDEAMECSGEEWVGGWGDRDTIPLPNDESLRSHKAYRVKNPRSRDVMITPCGKARQWSWAVIFDEKKLGMGKKSQVNADGRCLFRAIAHMVCLRNGEKAPDENRQKELADELRVQVVDELMKRRKETEWFIEGDFDAYVKRIQKTFVWGGEPELLMASHVHKTTISVYMSEKDSNNLSKIATYGEEYEQSENSSIKVLFHGYGHYDILEDVL
ncbi:putative OTU domain-containing protein [Tanacetum coccineum]